MKGVLEKNRRSRLAEQHNRPGAVRDDPALRQLAEGQGIDERPVLLPPHTQMKFAAS